MHKIEATVTANGLMYKSLDELLNMIPEVSGRMKHLVDTKLFKDAAGSSHNHQAWKGGYLDHVTETMNIACWMYQTSPRKLPFTLASVLTVLFLHDLEKPFKEECGSEWKSKNDRRRFRETLIQQNQIALTTAEWSALEYIEGEHDYSNKERKMNSLAAFCHMCDIASARLWWFHGEERKW